MFGTAQVVRSPVDDFAASVISQIHQQQIVGRKLPFNSVDSPSALLQCILVPSNSVSTCQGPRFRRTLLRGGSVLQGRFPAKPYLQVDDWSIPQVVWHLGEVELNLATSRGGVITVHLVGDGVEVHRQFTKLLVEVSVTSISDDPPAE